MTKSNTDSTLTRLLERPATLIQSCNSVERHLIEAHIIHETLKKEKPILLINGRESAYNYINRMIKYIPELQKYIRSEKIIFIDWFSWRAKKITSVEDEGTILYCDRDFVNINLAESIALRKIGGNAVAITDIITPLYATFPENEVANFIQDVFVKYHNKGLPFFAFVDKSTVDKKNLSSIHTIFNTIIDLELKPKGDVVYCKICEISKASSNVDYKNLFVTKKGIKIGLSSPYYLKHIVKQGIASKWKLLSTGNHELDTLLGGGIYLHGGILIDGTNNELKRNLAHIITANNLSKGHPVIYITSNPPDKIIEDIKSILPGIQEHTENGDFTIVDWHSWRYEKIPSVVTSEENIIKCGQDYANIKLAIDIAIQNINQDKNLPPIAVLDILPAASQFYDPMHLLGLAYSIKAKFDRQHIFTAYILDKTSMGDIRNNIRYLFDTVIECESHMEIDTAYNVFCIMTTPQVGIERRFFAVIDLKKFSFIEEEEMKKRIRYRESRKEKDLDPREFKTRKMKITKLIKDTIQMIKKNKNKISNRKEIYRLLKRAKEALRNEELSYATNYVLNARRAIKAQISGGSISLMPPIETSSSKGSEDVSHDAIHETSETERKAKIEGEVAEQSVVKEKVTGDNIVEEILREDHIPSTEPVDSHQETPIEKMNTPEEGIGGVGSEQGMNREPEKLEPDKLKESIDALFEDIMGKGGNNSPTLEEQNKGLTERSGSNLSEDIEKTEVVEFIPIEEEEDIEFIPMNDENAESDQ